MDQHYVPQSYLRGWCVGRHLIRYRRVGRPRRLVVDPVHPRSVAFQRDLYKIPPGGQANGLTDQDLERELARYVDGRIPGIVARAQLVTGRVDDERLARDLLLLVRTFVARQPAALARAEAAVASLVRDRRRWIQGLSARALSTPAGTRLSHYLDGRFPAVSARAGLAAVVRGESPDEWLAGDVHVLHARQVCAQLRAAGLDEFPTFDQPVVEWEGASAPRATFALAPSMLLMVCPTQDPGDPDSLGTLAVRHVIQPLAARRWLFCSRRLNAGAPVLAAASARLLPG